MLWPGSLARLVRFELLRCPQLDGSIRRLIGCQPGSNVQTFSRCVDVELGYLDSFKQEPLEQSRTHSGNFAAVSSSCFSPSPNASDPAASRFAPPAPAALPPNTAASSRTRCDFPDFVVLSVIARRCALFHRQQKPDAAFVLRTYTSSQGLAPKRRPSRCRGLCRRHSLTHLT